MLFHHQIFCASIAIALTTAMASAISETNCIDSSSYRSPKLGLACAQHKDLDCREFGVVGYSKDDIDDLLRQCPSSCAVGGCTTATKIMDNHQNQQGDNVHASVQRSRSLRGLLHAPTNTVSTCPAEWDETCRDDPNFISKLHLPCSQHVTLECSILYGIGFSFQDIVDLVSSCPCSCNVECSAPTTSPTTTPVTSKPSPGPTSAPVTSLPTASPVSDHPTAAPVTPEPSSSPVSDPPTASPVSDPPTALRHTSHPTIAPTTSSPSKIATESTSVSPSIESQDIQNVIAVAITSEEHTQNQNDHSALDFLPFSSSIFYGIIAAVTGMVIIVAVVGSVGRRRMKASSQHDDDNVTSRVKAPLAILNREASQRRDDNDDEKPKTPSLKSNTYQSTVRSSPTSRTRRFKASVKVGLARPRREQGDPTTARVARPSTEEASKYSTPTRVAHPSTEEVSKDSTPTRVARPSTEEVSKDSTFQIIAKKAGTKTQEPHEFPIRDICCINSVKQSSHCADNCNF